MSFNLKKEKKMAYQFNFNGKKVSVNSDGKIYVSGKFTGLKQWTSEYGRYSNLYGSEQKDLKGLSVSDVLKARGLVWLKCEFFKLVKLITSFL